MTGAWKNIEELEENISYPELVFLLNKRRELEQEHRIFLAAMQGVDLTNGTSDVDQKLEEVKHRAAARLAGGENELEKKEFAEFGIGFETV